MFRQILRSLDYGQPIDLEVDVRSIRLLASPHQSPGLRHFNRSRQRDSAYTKLSISSSVPFFLKLFDHEHPHARFCLDRTKSNLYQLI
jgi:hypothetical protein